ncbi:hypothetical protein ACIBK9_48100 [Nonomuraea sp. NPDC050227]|uniref:hypothetical protein n=1 Tax=Nonomuraea sp. NPDC050227 TaxID=3364360 RepID=UPI00379E0D19
MPEPVPPGIADQAATYLSDLQKLLQEQGLHARLLTHDERLPRLRVINPDAPSLSEVISAAPLGNEWSLWWSWAEPITPVNEIATAAERIRYVLTPTANQDACLGPQREPT